LIKDAFISLDIFLFVRKSFGFKVNIFEVSTYYIGINYAILLGSSTILDFGHLIEHIERTFLNPDKDSFSFGWLFSFASKFVSISNLDLFGNSN
jgi:hypothetical protein